MAHALHVVLSENRVQQSADRSIQKALLRGLRGLQGVDVSIVPHLYDLVPDGPAMRLLRVLDGDLVVIGWLYPRAAYWVLQANHIHGRMGHTSFFPDEELESLPPLPGGRRPHANDVHADRTIWCIDPREHAEAEPLLAEVERIAQSVLELVPVGAADAIHPRAKRVKEATRARWYPVVDYSRCGGCQHCRDFCPFEVFDVDDDGRLLVARPDECVGECMACARICDSGAILIPQESNSSIAGDVQSPRNGMRSSDHCEATLADELALAERNLAIAHTMHGN